MQDHVFGHDAARQLTFEKKTHRLRHLEEQLAGAHDETRVGIPDAWGKLAERSRHAGARVGAEEHFARPHVAFFRQGGVAHARELAAVLALELAARRVERPLPLRIVDHVVKVREFLLAHEFAQEVHVAVGQTIGREDVVIGDDDHFLAVPYLGVAPELPVELPDGARPTHVVGEQDIGVDPEVVAGLNPGLPAGPGEDGFGEGHRCSAGPDYAMPAGTAATGFCGCVVPFSMTG